MTGNPNWRILLSVFALLPFTFTIAWAQSTTSDQCFRKYPNCILVNWQPYNRKNAISESDCKQLCLSQQNSLLGTETCVSFVYDVQRQICDLYDRTGRSPPSRLIQFPGRDYYEPTGLCNGTGPGPGPTPPPAGPAPPGTTCGSGQVAKYTRVDGFELEGNDDATIPNLSEEECAKVCAENKGPNGTVIFCRSFDYRSGSRDCLISSSEALAPAGRGKPRKSPGSAYYQKFCIDQGAGANCPDIIDQEPQTVLEGLADLVIQANSLEDCAALCYGRRVANTPCLAGMFFTEASECILVSKDSKTNPELKIPAAPDDVVSYFEIGCAGGGGAGRFSSAGGRTSAGGGGGGGGGGGRPAVPFGTTKKPSISISPLRVRSRNSLTETSNSIDELENFRNFNVSCPIGECCPVFSNCLRGLKKLADGSIKRCYFPC